MAKIIDQTKKAVTNKNTWNDVKMGVVSGSLQGLGVYLLGATFGTILSAVGVGALPTKWKFVDATSKKIAVVNQVNDAVLNLLVGED